MQVQINEGQQMCMVCNDVANGVHFGALTCEGCKVRFTNRLLGVFMKHCAQDLYSLKPSDQTDGGNVEAKRPLWDLC